MILPLISIIVPVYNTEKYLQKCIESLLNQTYINIEVILINDGSTDSSESICTHFQNEDARVKFFEKKNEGLGPTRNFGIEQASGEYVMFVDSDDWIEIDAVELLVNEALQTKASVVFFDFIAEDCKEKKSTRSYENAKYMDCDNFFEAKMAKCFLPSSCTGMYLLDKWKKGNIVFPSTPFEDNAVYPLILQIFTNYVIIDKGLYHYRVNQGNTITKNIENDYKRFTPFFYLVQEINQRGYDEITKSYIGKFVKNQLEVSLNNICLHCDREKYLDCYYQFNSFFTQSFVDNFELELKGEITPVVTIIVPVHNSEKYLMGCLNSIREQTYADFEVLCIDDGSKDNTKKIIEDISAVDKRFIYNFDPNSSYGHKINEGISKAKGKYISILEADDMYSGEMLEVLVGIIDSMNVDFVDSDYSLVYTVEEEYRYKYTSKYHNNEYYNRLIIGSENRLLLNSCTSAIWTGLYKLDFLKKNEIQLNESEGASYQDVSFRFIVSSLAKKSYHVKRDLYFYRVDNEDSSVKDIKKILNIAGEYSYLKRKLFEYGLYEGSVKNYYYYWKYEAYMWNAKRLPQKLRYEFVPFFFDEIEKDKLNIRMSREFNNAPIFNAINELQKNPQAFFASVENENDVLINEENKNAILRNKIKNQNIVIFGAGRWGKEVLKNLDKDRSRVIFFCDNDERKNGQFIEGIEIIAPQRLINNKEAFFIIANKNASAEIYDELRLIGIKEEKIYVWND